MKNRNFKIGALLVSLFAASCSPALYQSGAYNIDDMYAEHDVTRIAQEKQAIAEGSQGRSGSPSRRNRGPAGGSRILRIGRLLPGRVGRHVRKRLCPSFAGIQLPDLSDADELFQPSLQRHLPIRFGLRPGRLQHHRHGRRSVGRTQIHYFDVRHMGFSQHSEPSDGAQVFITTGISVGVTIPIPGHTPVSAGLITATTPIGVILTGRLLPLLGLLSRLGRRPSPPPVPAAPSAQRRTPLYLPVRIGSGIEHRIDQFRRARPG